MYFCVLYDVSDLLIIIYNIFGCLVVDMLFEIMGELVKLFCIIGVKDVIGKLEWVS